MGHNDAFTGGVKPGGLTSTMEVRILLCYLIKTAAKTAAPLTRQELSTIPCWRRQDIRGF